MPAERFFVSHVLTSGQEIVLQDQEFHHLAHVMRAREGDRVEVIDGQGGLGEAVVTQITKREGHLKLSTLSFQPKSEFELILAQAIPRLHRLDIILEKATELGATQIWLFPSQLGERKALTDHQVERFHTITISAMKQCGRLYLPQIVVKKTLAEWNPNPYPLFFGDLDSEAPLLADAWKDHLSSNGVIFVTGPESGLKEEEIEVLRKINGIGTKLHSHTLRTDTASIVALGLLTHRLKI